MGPKPKDPVERFWPRVDKNGPIPNYAPHLGPCWIWTGAISSVGYGAFGAERVNGRNRNALAHRFAYEQLVGPIPEGLVLDHLCRVTRCVNPVHLEPVTHRENLDRGTPSASHLNRGKTHCKNGHEFTEENTYWFNEGRSRGCFTCRRETSRRWNERVSAERKRDAA